PEGQPLSYAWDLDNNGTFETPGQSVAYTGVDGPATLTVKVQATDNGGLTAIASATVTVNNVAPTATFGSNSPVNEASPATISFSNATDPSGPDVAAGLHFAFACDNASLAAATYASSGASASTTCTFADGPSTHTVGGRVIDKDGGYTGYTTVVTVNNVPPSVGAPTVTPEPSTEGSSVTARATFTDPGSLDAPYTCSVNYGDGSAVLPGVVSGATCTGPAHRYAKYGSYTVTVQVTDKDGGVGSNTAAHVVNLKWDGFDWPIRNLPNFNTALAGSAVPITFSLGGNEGMNIFASGYPLSQPVSCTTGAPLAGSTPSVTHGSLNLINLLGIHEYIYIWKTERAWNNTCRQFTLKLVDGTTHSADFKFK
ncbi:MAG TPA: PxKF domain-containing protein, partial [Polyangia bacterium]